MPATEKPDLWHAPEPGPLYWDWRCLRCGERCADHPGLFARLRHRWRRRRAKDAQEEDWPTFPDGVEAVLLLRVPAGVGADPVDCAICGKRIARDDMAMAGPECGVSHAGCYDATYGGGGERRCS